MVGAQIYMSKILQALAKMLILICVVVGAGLVYKSQEDKKEYQESLTNKKALFLKKYLLGYNKPQRIEITNLTKRLEKDVEEIKQMKVSLDPNSPFYVTIDFFTDENDSEAPLIASIKFIEIASQNKIKEDNINLE
jgi:hypothetical protein